jgi:hypothetical protein
MGFGVIHANPSQTMEAKRVGRNGTNMAQDHSVWRSLFISFLKHPYWIESFLTPKAVLLIMILS